MRRVLIVCCLLLLAFSQPSLQHVNGQTLASATLDPLPVVYVDFAYTGDESGTEEEPFNSLDEALIIVDDAGTIFLAPGVTHETPGGVSKNVTLQLWTMARQINPDAATVGDITSCGPDIDSFPITDPGVAPFLELAGDAALPVSGSGVDLVPQEDSKAGAVWSRRKVRVERGFDVSFSFNLHPSSAVPDNDGISFVIQNSGATPSLTTGGNMGYTGISNSVAVEYDHWQNPETHDPSGSHVSIQSAGPNQANSADHATDQIAIGETSFLPTSNTGRVVYNPRAQTLKAYLNGILVAQAEDFNIKDWINLSDGCAYIGVVATTGVEAGTYGPTRLNVLSASFPQSCEKVFWEKPENYSLFTGYNGDVFDHKITGTFLQAGDIIREEVVWQWDDVGLNGDDKTNIKRGANGTWLVDSRPGLPGLWRMRDPAMPPPILEDDKFDHHGLETQEPHTSTFKNFRDAGGTIGTVELLQTMRLVDADGEPDNDMVVARHRLVFRYVKIDPAFTGPPPGPPSCTFDDAYHFHQTVQKQTANNTAGVWVSANADPPWIPCPGP